MFKNVLKKLGQNKMVLNSIMLAGGVFTVLFRYGCCFFIYHQPKYPEALRVTEE